MADFGTVDQLHKIALTAWQACNGHVPLYLLNIMVGVTIRQIHIVILVELQLLPWLGLRQLPQLLEPTDGCGDKGEQTSRTTDIGIGILNHDQIPGCVVVGREPAGRKIYLVTNQPANQATEQSLNQHSV